MSPLRALCCSSTLTLGVTVLLRWKETLWCSPVGPIHCRCFFLETVGKGWREGGRGCSQAVSPQEPTAGPICRAL